MDERRIEFGRVILRTPHAAHLMARPPIRVIEAIERTFEEPEPTEALRPSIEAILAVVAEVHGVTVTALKSERRALVLTRARQEAMWLARDLTLRSSGAIGRVIGKRDHTTILHGIAQVEARRRADPDLAARLETMATLARARAARRATE